MDQKQSIRIATMLEQALAPVALTARARETGFVQRLRCITPHRLALSLILTLATQKVETLADLWRGFAAASQVKVTYKPFYNQLAKPQFAAFMQAVLELLLERLVLAVLAPTASTPLAQFRDLHIHDSTEFKLPDWFRERFPGRFPVKAPAVAALHTTLSLRRDQPVRIQLAPQKDAARTYRPAPETLAEILFLGDRAYADCLYVEAVDAAGGACLIRATKRMNPKIRAGWVGDQPWSPALGGKLQAVLAGAAGISLDLEVEFPRSKRRPHKVRVRLVALWNPVTQEHVLFLTNLARETFPLALLGAVYRLRWQVELLFKEWKSYANLHAFTTENETLATGLIWASLAAAFLKRFCVHATAQVFAGAALSTRRAAMALPTHLREVVHALLRQRPVLRALQELFRYLQQYAQRAHPRRDAATGRGRTGMHSVGRSPGAQRQTARRSSSTPQPLLA